MRVYRTITNQEGWSGLPDYELRADGKFYRTLSHPAGWTSFPEYEIERTAESIGRSTIRWAGAALPTTSSAATAGPSIARSPIPGGWGALADFELRD
jgi:hypothetical protein